MNASTLNNWDSRKMQFWFSQFLFSQSIFQFTECRSSFNLKVQITIVNREANRADYQFCVEHAQIYLLLIYAALL